MTLGWWISDQVALLQPWHLGVLWSGLQALILASVGYSILRARWQRGDWLSNPLAAASGALLLAVGIGEGGDVNRLLTERCCYGDVALLADGLAAFASAWYALVRWRHPSLGRSGVLFRDLDRTRDNINWVLAAVAQPLQRALDTPDDAALRVEVAKVLVEVRHRIATQAPVPVADCPRDQVDSGP